MAKTRIQISFAAAAAVLALGSLNAAGTTGAEVLRARLAARPAAMGDAYVAAGDDIFAGQYNPAGLEAIEKAEVSFLHWESVAQTAYESFAWAQTFDFGSIGANLGLRSFPDIDNPLAPDNPVSGGDLVFGLSYAVKPYRHVDFLPEVMEEASVGISVKYLNSRLSDHEANGVAIDAGIRWPLPSQVMLGIALLNLGPNIVFIEEGDPLPSTATVGVARTFELGKINRLNTAADLEVGLDGDTRIHFGAEDWIARPLAIRVGYILEDARSAGGLSAGAGLKLDQESLTMQIDYAYKPFFYDSFNSFDGQHIISAMLRF